jgi:hypothetical protein
MRRLLVRVYPRAWRERYGDELLELLDETGFGPREALDVLRSGVRLRAGAVRDAFLDGGYEMVIGPAWRHPTGWAVAGAVIIAPTLLMVGLSVLTYELGQTSLIAFMEPVNNVLQRVRPLDLALVVSPVLALLAAVVPLLRLELRDGGTGEREALLGLRLRVPNLLVGLLSLAVGGMLVWHIVVESVLQVGA